MKSELRPTIVQVIYQHLRTEWGKSSFVLSVFLLLAFHPSLTKAQSTNCSVKDISSQSAVSDAELSCYLRSLEAYKEELGEAAVIPFVEDLVKRVNDHTTPNFIELLILRNECYINDGDKLSAMKYTQSTVFKVDSLTFAKPSESWDELYGLAQFQLALCYDQAKNGESAIHHLSIARNIFSQREDSMALSRIYNLTAGTYINRSQLDSALFYFKMARTLVPLDERGNYEMVVTGNIGKVLLELDRLDDAEREFQHGMKQAEAGQSEFMKSWYHSHFGSLALQRKNYEKAKSCLLKVDSLIDKDAYGFPLQVRADNSRQLAFVAKQLDDVDLEVQALRSALLADSLMYSSVFNEETRRLSAYYDREQAESENKLLLEQIQRQQELDSLQWKLFALALGITVAAILLLRQIRSKNKQLEATSRSLEDKSKELMIANDSIVSINQNLEEKVAERTQQLLESNESLRVSERLSRLGAFTIESINIGVFWFSEEGKYIKFNQEAMRMFGYSAEELVKVRTEEFDAETEALDFPQYWEITKERKSWVIDRKLRRKSGETFATELYSYHLDFDGKEFICALVLDVDKRKENQRQLKLRIQYEQTISRLANNLVNAPSERLDEVIQDSLKEVGEIMEADRTYLVTLDRANEVYNLTYSWARKEAFAHNVEAYSNISIEENSLYKLHQYNMPLHINTVEEMPATAVRERRAYTRDGLKTVCMVPNYAEGNMYGWAGADTLEVNRYEWGELEINMLQIIGELVSSALERKRKVQLLETSQNRIQLALNAGQVGLWEVNLETEKRFYSKGFFNIMPLPREVFDTLTFEQWLQHLHSDDRLAFKTAWIKALKNEGDDGIVIDFRFGVKNGYRWLNLEGKATQRDENGWVVVAQGVLKDITASREQASELDQLNRRLGALIGSLPGIVYRCKADEFYTMEFLSVSFETITGYNASDFINNRKRKWEELIHPDDKNWDQAAAEKQIKEEGIYRYSYRMIRKDGGIVYCYEQGVPVVDTNGDIIGFEGYITDVTTKVKSEERIMAVLLEAEDKERRRIAKELHDSLGQTLTAANFNFDALRNRVDFNSASEPLYKNAMLLLEKAIRETRNISHGIMPKDIDDFGYVMATQSLISGVHSVSDLHFHFFDNLQGDRLPHNLELNLFRITQEAINNTIKYAEATEVTIQLMTYEKDLILTIEDNGKGFNLASLETKGTSLGIRNMRNRAAAFSGEFIFDSSVGRGTSITITIPLERTETENNYANAN